MKNKKLSPGRAICQIVFLSILTTSTKSFYSLSILKTIVSSDVQIKLSGRALLKEAKILRQNEWCLWHRSLDLTQKGFGNIALGDLMLLLLDRCSGRGVRRDKSRIYQIHFGYIRFIVLPLDGVCGCFILRFEMWDGPYTTERLVVNYHSAQDCDIVDTRFIASESIPSFVPLAFYFINNNNSMNMIMI